MSKFEEDFDALNEETFGNNDYYDWEAEHEKHINDQFENEPAVLGKLDSFFSTNLINHRSDECNGLEASIKRLIDNDDEHDDPAIVNCLKKVQKNVNSSFNKPCDVLYSNVHPKLVNNKENDIWKFEKNIVEEKCFNGHDKKSQASAALDMIEKFFSLSLDREKMVQHQQQKPHPVVMSQEKKAYNINFSVPPPKITNNQDFLNNLYISSKRSSNPPLNLDSSFMSDVSSSIMNRSDITTTTANERRYNQSHASYSDHPFDPITDIWTTRHEKTYILKIKNIFLQNIKPYINDYYYSIFWLRNITKKKQQIAEQNYSVNTFSPLLAIPPPVTVEDLAEEMSYHNLVSDFVITDPSVEEDNEIKEDTQSQDLNNSQLGKLTKTNYRTQRIIAELSVISAVTRKKNKKKTEKDESKDETNQDDSSEMDKSTEEFSQHPIDYQYQASVLRKDRERTILLAQIEKVYSIVLNLDEIDFALVRINEPNDDFKKLIQYKDSLLDRLLSNFFLRPANENELLLIGLESHEDPDSLTDGYHVPDLNILSVRKGCRVFLQVLPYLSNYNLQLSFAYFITNFTIISNIVNISLEELSKIFYPVFKPLTTRINNLKKFLNLCLPDSSEFLIGDSVKAKSAIDFIFTSLGLSFVLNLLDLFSVECAYKDQSDLINYCTRLMKCLGRSDEERPMPLDNFPSLLTALTNYMNSVLRGSELNTVGVITTSELNMLISLISSGGNSHLLQHL